MSLPAITWLLFAVMALHYGFAWVNAQAGTALPHLGDVPFTLVFTGFSLLHAWQRLGPRRTVAFFVITALVSWCFEQVGVSTGLVYGAYHYSDKLGAKLGAVPLIIPLAWFMMIYASWTVAGVLLGGPDQPGEVPARGFGPLAARAVVSALVMTAWDTVMDPGMARSGNWVWESGGAYFGVPLQNYAGWMVTTVTVYLLVEVSFRLLGRGRSPPGSRLFGALPVFAYTLVACDGVLVGRQPELRVSAAFSMCLVAVVALCRLATIRPAPLP
jgi:putative membrane protein